MLRLQPALNSTEPPFPPQIKSTSSPLFHRAPKVLKRPCPDSATHSVELIGLSEGVEVEESLPGDAEDSEERFHPIASCSRFARAKEKITKFPGLRLLRKPIGNTVNSCYVPHAFAKSSLSPQTEEVEVDEVEVEGLEEISSGIVGEEDFDPSVTHNKLTREKENYTKPSGLRLPRKPASDPPNSQNVFHELARLPLAPQAQPSSPPHALELPECLRSNSIESSISSESQELPTSAISEERVYFDPVATHDRFTLVSEKIPKSTARKLLRKSIDDTANGCDVLHDPTNRLIESDRREFLLQLKGLDTESNGFIDVVAAPSYVPKYWLSKATLKRELEAHRRKTKATLTEITRKSKIMEQAFRNEREKAVQVAVGTLPPGLQQTIQGDHSPFTLRTSEFSSLASPFDGSTYDFPDYFYPSPPGIGRDLDPNGISSDFSRPCTVCRPSDTERGRLHSPESISEDFCRLVYEATELLKKKGLIVLTGRFVDAWPYFQSAITSSTHDAYLFAQFNDGGILLEEFVEKVHQAFESLLPKEAVLYRQVKFRLRHLRTRCAIHASSTGFAHVEDPFFLENVVSLDVDPAGHGGQADCFFGSHKGEVVFLRRRRLECISYTGLPWDEAMNKEHILQAFKKTVYPECLMWREIRHENIIQIVGITLDAFPIPAIVLPLKEHGDARSYMTKHSDKIENDEQFRLIFKRHCHRAMLSMCSALCYLHEEGIAHGDIRAANVLFDSKMEAFLTDFGISSYATATPGKCGSMHAGNARWRSPELFRESTRATFEGDIWSFGLFCWELYTNRNPLQDLGDRPSDFVILNHLYRKAESTGRPEGSFLPPEPQPYFHNLNHRPDRVDDHLWTVLSKCWLHNEKDHPKFRIEVDQLYSELQVVIPPLTQAG